MSNADVIRAFIKTVWDEGQPEAAEAYLADSYVDHTYAGGGREGLKAQIAQLTSAFSGVRHVIEDIVVDGDRLMLRARLQGTHTGQFRHVTASQAQIDVRVARWFRLENGRIAEHWALLDTAGLFAQLGASVKAA
jgi:predicted ester cyclase